MQSNRPDPRLDPLAPLAPAQHSFASQPPTRTCRAWRDRPRRCCWCVWSQCKEHRQSSTPEGAGEAHKQGWRRRGVRQECVARRGVCCAAVASATHSNGEGRTGQTGNSQGLQCFAVDAASALAHRQALQRTMNARTSSSRNTSENLPPAMTSMLHNNKQGPVGTLLCVREASAQTSDQQLSPGRLAELLERMATTALQHRDDRLQVRKKRPLVKQSTHKMWRCGHMKTRFSTLMASL